MGNELATAADSGQVDVVVALLGAGTRPAPDLLEDVSGGEHCLGAMDLEIDFSSHPAAQRQASPQENLAIAQALLGHGVDPAGRPGHKSPLLLAAYTGQRDLVAVLLAHDAPVDLGGPVTIMELGGAAAEAEGRSCIEGLAYPGAMTPSSLPSTTLFPAPTTTLFPVVQVPPTGVDNVTPLIAAALTGHQEIAAMLLDHGADPNALAGGLVSPLYAAAARGDEAMVHLLLDRGATPVPAAPPTVLTPAQVATHAGHPAVAALLTSG